jgi:hypothetical protein
MAERSPYTESQLSDFRSIAGDDTQPERLRAQARECLRLHAKFALVLADGRTIEEVMGIRAKSANPAGRGIVDGEFKNLSPEAAARRLAELEGR